MTSREMYTQFLNSAQIAFKERELFSGNTALECIDQMADQRSLCMVFAPDGSLVEFGTYEPGNH